MGRGHHIGRWIVASLSAYAMLLHILMMAGMAAPAETMAGHAMQAEVHCAGEAGAEHAHHPAPAAPTHHSTPSCVLCFTSGSAPPDVPATALLAPPAIVHTAPRLAGAEAPPQPRRLAASAQPRAPPAYA
jgi:hypothetical protein